METTFMSIHDLSKDARLLYVSKSVTDILGYMPEELVGRSCWDYFHPDEIPFAHAIHGRGVKLDKAAVLNYCQIINRDGVWVGCECVFTVVHDVMVSCTSIYRRGDKSLKRATEAPIIRQLFSSSPRDPRYHMLSYISSKFTQDLKPHVHEPRAALFLNRFTRTLTIMYATNGLADLLGITADELNGKSFYYCIAENCLSEAVRCLESAKENDSIAYLRFWFRDPREDDGPDSDDDRSDVASSDHDEDGGVGIDVSPMDTDGNSSDHGIVSSESYVNSQARSGMIMRSASRSNSGHSTDLDSNTGLIFDQPPTVNSSTSSLGVSVGGSDDQSDSGSRHCRPIIRRKQIELEAVVSCTSDGLVVILRGARPFLPTSVRAPVRTTQPIYANGLFAAPWALNPIVPNYHQHIPYSDGFGSVQITGLRTTPVAPQGPTADDFMKSIREVAVFAWSLTGINGSLVQYSRGIPRGQSTPPTGVPVWVPGSAAGTEAERHNGLYSRFTYADIRIPYPMTPQPGLHPRIPHHAKRPMGPPTPDSYAPRPEEFSSRTVADSSRPRGEFLAGFLVSPLAELAQASESWPRSLGRKWGLEYMSEGSESPRAKRRRGICS